MERASRVQQAGIYFGKCRRAFVNEKGWKNLISTLIISILIIAVVPESMLYSYGATRNGCFAMICACIWIGVFNSIQSICRERDILKREHRSGLHMSAYIAAHMLYEMLLSFAEALIVTAVFTIGTDTLYTSDYQGIMSAVPPTVTGMPAVIELMITFFLLIYSSDALGIMISSIVKTPNSAMTVMPFVLIIELVMCGYIFELEGATDLISNLTVSKWAMSAMCTVVDVNSMDDYIPQFAANYTHSAGHLLSMWMILIGFTLLYGVLATVSLEFIDRDKR